MLHLYWWKSFTLYRWSAKMGTKIIDEVIYYSGKEKKLHNLIPRKINTNSRSKMLMSSIGELNVLLLSLPHWMIYNEKWSRKEYPLTLLTEDLITKDKKRGCAFTDKIYNYLLYWFKEKCGVFASTINNIHNDTQNAVYMQMKMWILHKYSRKVVYCQWKHNWWTWTWKMSDKFYRRRKSESLFYDESFSFFIVIFIIFFPHEESDSA